MHKTSCTKTPEKQPRKCTITRKNRQAAREVTQKKSIQKIKEAIKIADLHKLVVNFLMLSLTYLSIDTWYYTVLNYRGSHFVIWEIFAAWFDLILLPLFQNIFGKSQLPLLIVTPCLRETIKAKLLSQKQSKKLISAIMWTQKLKEHNINTK